MRTVAILLLAAASSCDAPRVVAVGDSITYGLNATSAPPKPWTDVLAASGYSVVNQGVPSDTACHMVERGSEADAVYDAKAFSNTAILFAGINDLSLGATPEAAAACIRQWTRDRVAHGWRVYVIPPTPAATVDDAQRKALVALEVAGVPGATVIDIEALDPGLMDPALRWDGVHFTDEGYARIGADVKGAMK